MNPIVAVLMIAGLTTFARWQKGETLTPNHIISFFILGILLAFIATINEPLAKGFSWLAVIGTLLAHAEPLSKAVRGPKS